MVDAAEDERWGEDFRGDELPEELQRREKRLAAIQAAKARLEAAQRGRDDERGREPGQDRNPRGGRPYKRAYGEPEPKAQSNFTDPESQIMKTSSEGFQQCYNAQMAVDGEHRIIVATQVGPQASDQGEGYREMLEHLARDERHRDAHGRGPGGGTGPQAQGQEAFQRAGSGFRRATPRPRSPRKDGTTHLAYKRRARGGSGHRRGGGRRAAPGRRGRH